MLNLPNKSPLARFGNGFDERVMHSKVNLKLSRALMQTNELEKKERELQVNYNSLQGRYDKLLKGSMHAMWEYCTQKSADFAHIPPCDHHLTGKQQKAPLTFRTRLTILTSLYNITHRKWK